MEVPVAPAAEQTRIADQLDTLLARIQACQDRLDAIPALLKRFRQAVLDAATSGKLTVDWREESAIGAWAESLIGKCGDVSGGLTKSAKRGSLPLVKPYLRVANVQSNRLNLADVSLIGISPSEHAKTRLNPGDLLIVEGNGSIDQVGRVALWGGELEDCVHQNHLIRWRSRGPSPRWILIWLLSNEGRRALMTRASTTTGLYTLSISKVSSVPVRLPCLTEQTEIVRRVEALFQLADRIETRHTAALAQAQRLSPLTLAKAFRGELVPQDAKDEPASQLLQRIAEAQAMSAKAAPRGQPRSKSKPEAPAVQPATPFAPPALPDWSALPAGAWADHGAPQDEHLAATQLIAVLRAWGRPMPQEQARLAALLCLQPRLCTGALPASPALQWRRLVGAVAEPLPAQVTAFQPAVNIPWRRALAGMRARGDLLESGASAQDTWALGPGAAGVDTSGWPDGRAAWIVAYLRAHGVESLLPSLAAPVLEFVHAHAA